MTGGSGPTADGRPDTVDRVVVEADGGSRGNPGPAGYGAVVMAADTRRVLAERWESIGVDTNNVAEYRGLIAGLTAALELGATGVHVRMDSRLVIEQVQGNWKVKHPGLVPLARQATGLLSRFGTRTFEWIPRAQNSHADRLANRAMDEAAGRPTSRSSAATPRPESPATLDLDLDLDLAPAPARWVPDDRPATRLVLVRHGATEHSPARRLSGRNELPLSADGEHQAAALARRAPSLRLEAVVCSPLRRARQTAEALAGALDLPVTVEPGLIETDFGAWEGLTGAEAADRDPDLFARWAGSVDVAAPGGESLAEVIRRARRARDAVIAAHPGRIVAVVSHVTPIKALLITALGAPSTSMFRLFLDTASVSRVDYAADGGSSVRLVNDTSHLRHA